MSILTAMQKAAIRLVGYSPSVFFGSSDQFEPEIVDLINEGAKEILDYQDWQSLIKIATLTGDGTAEEFAFPADYEKMMLTADIQDPENWVFGYRRSRSLDDFIWMKARGWGPFPGVWTMYQNKFQFYPAPAAGQEAVFPYISKHYAIDAGGSTKAEFTQDTDTFAIEGAERLLTLFLVWRWRENKKLDATGDEENFAKALSDLAAKDGGSKVYRSRVSRLYGNIGLAWPYQLGS